MSKANKKTVQLPPNVEVSKPSDKPFVDFFEALGNNCQWITLGLLCIMAAIVFKDFLFFDKIFLYKDIGSDSLNLSYPILSHNVRYMKEFGFNAWSFEFGMGQNAFSFSLYDPIDYLLYPLGVEKMRTLLGWKVAIELILAGFIFYHYLQALSIKKFASIIGSLMYAFCGFMIVSSCWFIFSVEVLAMSFVLLGMEKIIQKNQWWLFSLPIAYLVLSRPFVLATLSIFLLAYCTLRYFQRDSFIWKDYMFTLGKSALAGLCGVALAAPFLFEHIQIMLDSPRGSGANSLSGMLQATPMFQVVDKIQLGTAISRMFATDILGSGVEFKGWQNILEAPAFYCGIPALLLIPQLFFLSNKRLKIVYGVFLGFWLIPVLFPYFRYAFSFFTGDYYRSFSFYVAIVLLLLAVFGLQEILKQNKVHVIGLASSILILLALLFFPYFESDVRDSTITGMVVLLMLLYAFLLFSFPKQDSKMRYAFLGVLVMELVFLSSITINNRDVVTKSDVQEKIGYNDYTVDALKYLKNIDKSFYRIDKRYASTPAMHSSLNDGMAQGYYGTSSYNSFNQKYYIQYLKAVGIISGTQEAETRWASGLTSRFILEGLNSVKYVLSKSPSDNVTRAFFDSVTTVGNVQILKHKYALPLGYAFTSAYSLQDFTSCSANQKDFMSLRAAIIADTNKNEVSSIPFLAKQDTLNPTLVTFELLQSYYDSLRAQSFQVRSFTPNHIEGNISLSKPSIVYFSIPYDKNWSIKDKNNKEQKCFLLTNGMMGIQLPAGEHALSLNYSIQHLGLGKKISLAGLFLFGVLIFISFRFKKKDA